eukprot:7146305-Prymnesium_polylepis.1
MLGASGAHPGRPRLDGQGGCCEGRQGERCGRRRGVKARAAERGGVRRARRRGVAARRVACCGGTRLHE